MEKKTKIILGISIALALGAGAFILLNRSKDKDEDELGAPSADSLPDVKPSGETSAKTKDIELAKKYRIWANSTDALSKKYGKKSSFDLDATSSNPYNKFFLNSYKVGRADYLKSLEEAAKATVSATVLANQKKKSFPNDWYVLRKDELVSLFDGWTSDSDEGEIINVMKQLKTNADWERLFAVFKTLDGWNLRKWLDYELSNTQRAEINSNWASKGITKSSGQPQTLTVK